MSNPTRRIHLIADPRGRSGDAVTPGPIRRYRLARVSPQSRRRTASARSARAA